MQRLAFPSRLAILAAAALGLAACGGTVDFSVDEDLEIDTTVNGGAGLAAVDLATSAGSAWKHRNKIDSVSIQSATATVTAVKAGNTAATASGTAWLLPEGATEPTAAGAVQIGTWSGEEVAVGNVIDLAVTPALNDFVRSTFDGSGKFSIYAIGSTTGGDRVAVTLHVALDAKLKWKLL